MSLFWYGMGFHRFFFRIPCLATVARNHSRIDHHCPIFGGGWASKCCENGFLHKNWRIGEFFSKKSVTLCPKRLSVKGDKFFSRFFSGSPTRSQCPFSAEATVLGARTKTFPASRRRLSFVQIVEEIRDNRLQEENASYCDPVEIGL